MALVRLIREMRKNDFTLGIFIGLLIILYLFDFNIKADFVRIKARVFESKSGEQLIPNVDINVYSTVNIITTDQCNTTQYPTTVMGNAIDYRDVEYANRRLRLKSACRNMSMDTDNMRFSKDLQENIIVDQQHQLVYCQIQKVASTFMHKILTKLNEGKEMSKFETQQMELRKTDEFKDRMDFIMQCKKIIFVREPYGRVLSGYVDKLFAPNSVFWDGIGKAIISRTRVNASTISKTCGHDVTFPEFIQYAIYVEENEIIMDPHFTPMHRHCQPCQVPFDFIGKIETMKDDALYLIESWNKEFNKNITFDDFATESDIEIVLQHTDRLFTMKKDIIECTSFYKAMWRTWRDLQIRGILPIEIDLPFKEYESHKVKRMHFFREAEQAIKNIADRTLVKQQRQESLVEAYSLLSKEDKYRLQEILATDCKLFGYDCRPSELFDIEQGSIKQKYFTFLF